MRRKPRASLRPFWFVGTALLAVAVAAGYYASSWPGFDAKHVRVVGNAVVPAREIVAAAEIDPRSNIWLQNAGAMARRVERIPYIFSASVHRRPPAQVTIAVRERHPFAVVSSDGESALVDPQLRVLVQGEAPQLPVLVLRSGVELVPGRFLNAGSGAAALRGVLLALRAHDVEPNELTDTNGDVSAILPGDIQILLGDESTAARATPLIEPILTRFALLGRYVRTLDLRSPTTPVVTERKLSTVSEPRSVRPVVSPSP